MCPTGLPVLVCIAFVFCASTRNGSCEPVDLVNPMIGTGVGACMPGPCLPHASIYPSPDTLAPRPSGYNHKEPIVGFSQLHTQGTGGKPSYGNFLISPQIGLEIQESAHASAKGRESAAACRYSVRLEKYGIDCAVVPSVHSALYRFDFPESADASIVLDVARKVGGKVALKEGSVRLDPATGTITGGGTFGDNWAPGTYPLFFAAKASKVPAAFGVWTGETVREGAVQEQSKGQSLGAFFRFPTTGKEPVFLKIAVSFKSVEQAAKWLENEIPGWDMSALEARARAAWNGKLGRVSLEGASPSDSQKIYTALWHAMVQPRDRTGDTRKPGEPFWDDHYTLWDSWKTLFPLLAIVDPKTEGEIINSFIARHKNSPDGYVGTGFVQGLEFRTGQGGDEVDNILADAYLKQVPGVDWNAAYDLLKQHADVSGRMASYRTLGYVPAGETAPYCNRMKSASGTLAFACNDHSASVVASGLGRHDDAARWLKRSSNWENVWDDSAADAGFQGFPRGRRKDGSFNDAGLRKNYNVDYYEATSWEGAYVPTFALDKLVEKMGGREQFIERLEFALKNKWIDFGNEPSFMTPWLFAAVDRPDLTSQWAKVYRDKFNGNQLPGDDDQGAMSAMYLFLVSGFFPFAAQDVYYLHGPAVPRIAFQLANGKTFTVTGKNVAPENIYIQSVRLNGKPLSRPLLRHGDILNGGTLEFVMGPQPPPRGWK